MGKLVSKHSPKGTGLKTRPLSGFLFSIFQLALAGLILFPSCARRNAPAPADLVLNNGVIYTVDGRSSSAEAVAIKDGKFVFVGSNAGAAAYIGSRTAVTDLQGRFALPGFIDSHAHAVSAYRIYFEVDLTGLKTVEAIQTAIRDFAATHPGASFVRGRGWSNTEFPNAGPDRAGLDAVVPDIPAAFGSEDGHSIWVNSKTLTLAGISKATPNPPGGIIERDPKTGDPNGTLRESAAGLVSKIFPPLTAAEYARGIEAYQNMALAFGITTVHEADVTPRSREIEAFKDLEKAGRLRLRFRASLSVDPEKGPEQVAALTAERDGTTGELFQTRAAKIFVDGVVEGGTAYLKEPYAHLPDSHGEFLWTAENLNRVCAELDRRGFQIHVHAIGDAAAAVTLDALAFARKENGPRDGRPMITHLQLVAPGDILRFKELGVTAIPQPYWFAKDSYYHNLQVPYLGQSRADAEYPMKSFFEAGVLVASGSDYPVTIPCNPLVAVQMGITRREPGKTLDEDALWPEESVSLKRMIESVTINGAKTNFLESEAGSIETGKSADLIVLDRNLFEIPVEEISRVKVLMTIFKGKTAYEDKAGVGRQGEIQ